LPQQKAVISYNDLSDLTAITSGHFLIGKNLVGLPEPEKYEKKSPKNCK